MSTFSTSCRTDWQCHVYAPCSGGFVFVLAIRYTGGRILGIYWIGRSATRHSCSVVVAHSRMHSLLSTWLWGERRATHIPFSFSQRRATKATTCLEKVAAHAVSQRSGLEDAQVRGCETAGLSETHVWRVRVSLDSRKTGMLSITWT